MGKDDEQVMVVNKDILFGDGYFQGFQPVGSSDYESRIMKHLHFMRRGDVENNLRLDLKQPISYLIIVNPSSQTVFAYQRPDKSGSMEKRHQGKWSWGVGGHINPCDSDDPLHASLYRELEEEVGVLRPNIKNLKVIGYINDDVDSLGKDHFGILYAAETCLVELRPRKEEMAQGKFLSIGELEEILRTPEVKVETWSQIALDPLKKYFEANGLRHN